MKSFNLVIVAAFVLFSCNETGKKDTSYLPSSLGNINNLQVITTNEMWNGNVGEAIRDILAAPADGLPQEEPLYDINQMPPSTYTGFARKYRIFLHLTKGASAQFSIKEHPYAKPQTGVFITAPTEEELIALLKEHQKEILTAFQASEISENQRRIKISLKKDLDSLKQRLGVKLNIPSAYRTARATDEFFWIRKDLKSGSTNIIIYEVPLSMIGTDSSVVGNIIKIRDSIGSSYMPVEDEGLFITEEAYAPYLFTSEIDGKFAYETKGTWEVKDKYMAGPFLNYAIRDEANNRYLILEGFTYAPSVAKRNLQFELEAILKSAKLE
ncbi:MAG: DUF4837 family protein [Altibacter sp.]|uniref:DUF4837 family protein n=1 Tax=Altibacter sp. TaxID=2024823 RepID=UPI001DAC753B|nr:DUF4837 family protein [Altibacter sp.]MBZ0327495.1 DUF4837 family protein [Altibacter sp.]